MVLQEIKREEWQVLLIQEDITHSHRHLIEIRLLILLLQSSHY